MAWTVDRRVLNAVSTRVVLWTEVVCTIELVVVVTALAKLEVLVCVTELAGSVETSTVVVERRMDSVDSITELSTVMNGTLEIVLRVLVILEVTLAVVVWSQLALCLAFLRQVRTV